MDRLWSPWRYRYIASAREITGCIFCEKAAANEDEANFIVHRGQFNFAILNAFPYTSGHLMVAPYQHVRWLEDAHADVASEMMLLTRRAQALLRSLYRSDGINLGMNLGEAAGAGIVGHIHMHVLPRWVGDANFMTTVGETRVLPEELSVTYQKLRGADWKA
ncbi:MAG TPA: HIT domain-containing protein [Bryobacteraceae bacterium]|nr:HIT domain-containing protein [Bryobacteraceae bacterium]